jgi:hypothetical protein
VRVRPSYIPLPVPPKRVDHQRLRPRVNRAVRCVQLAMPGFYWEQLQRPHCWNTDLGVVGHYPEDLGFVVGFSPARHAAVLIFDTANGPMRTRVLVGAGEHPVIASVDPPVVCLAPTDAAPPSRAINWSTSTLVRSAACLSRR